MLGIFDALHGSKMFLVEIRYAHKVLHGRVKF